MATKDYGSLVSGYRDPEGRNWETTIFQASKPVLDAELNLTQDAEQDMESRLRLRSLPSGWLADDFLNNSDSTIGIFTGSATADELAMPQDLRAHVNGWFIRCGNTNSNTLNALDLGAGPTGAGAKRTDLVVLEVWRRLLAPTPSAAGKSPGGNIWWYGNVKIRPADDGVLNFADDIEDVAVGAETTKRVQIQYRLRVIQNVDVYAYPYGIDDPNVVAHSVPPAAATPDGTVTVHTYVSQSAAGDPGLWRAGDGNPANTLGTVDGYMYAIPLMAVFRRNDTAFDRVTNHNGGVATPGPSDRPDGLFYDILDQRDIADLRFGVDPIGWNFREVLDKNFAWLMDNAVRTEITTTPHGGGCDGNTLMYADEIGVSNANGGTPPTTGDTAGATFVGQFDSVRRRFSDRCIHETLWLEIVPGAPWVGNEVVTISPAALPIYPYGPFNWAAYAPAGATIVDVLDLWWNGSASVVPWNTGGTPSNATGVTISGLGTVPMGAVTLDFSAGAGGMPTPLLGTSDPLFVKLEVSYPTGVGLSETPTADYGTASFSVNNPGQLPAGTPVFYASDYATNINNTWREVEISYQTVALTYNVAAPITASMPLPADTLIMPERVLSLTGFTVNAGPDISGTVTISADGYTLTAPGASFVAGDALVVTFTAARPYPQNDEQITIYYDARAPQPMRDGALPTSVTLIPRYISPELFTLIGGSGSQDEAFPWPTQYVQQPGVYPSSGGSYNGDHEMNGGSEVVLADWNADTGFLKVPALIGYVPNPQEAIFQRLGGDVDSEGRSFYKDVPGGAYLPSAFGQNLEGHKRHRTVLPMVVELSADSTIGQKGQLFVAILGAWHPFSNENSIAFDTNLADNYSSMSLYRVKGNLLNRRSA